MYKYALYKYKYALPIKAAEQSGHTIIDVYTYSYVYSYTYIYIYIYT